MKSKLIAGLLTSMALMAPMMYVSDVRAADPLSAADKSALETGAHTALESLYAKTPAAKALGDKAAGILVFPDVGKAGLIVGGYYGKGVLYKKGHVTGYYSTGGASVGLQIGAQSYGYTLFLMNDKAVSSVEAGNYEFGMGPSIVIVDSGAAKNITTTTAKSDIYAFIFNQSGLMAGLSLQGSKINFLEPK